MRKKIFKSILGGCICMLPMLSHGQEPTASLDTTPLVVYGDSVKFEASIHVPAHKVFKKEGTYVIMPELGDVKFEPIRIPSSELGNAAKEGITVNIASSAKFDEDMIGNDLEIEHEYEYKEGQRNTEFKDMDDLAECCVMTGQLFAVNGQYEHLDYVYMPAMNVPLKVVAQVNFPLDIAKFNNPESDKVIGEIGEYIKAYPGSTITIRGFASPDGTVERNEELSKERAEKVQAWIVDALRANRYGKYLKNTNIQVENTEEDWRGFQQLVADSDLSEEKQMAVLDHMFADLSASEKEAKVVEELGGMENAEKYLMPLRRTTIVVSHDAATRPGFTLEEIDSVNQAYVQGDMTLSGLKSIFEKEEFLQASLRSDASKGRVTLVNSYYETYPEDYRIYSRLGELTHVDMNKIDIIGGDDALAGIGFSRDMVDIDSELDVDEDKIKYKYKYKEEDVRDPEKIKIKIKADREQAINLLTEAYNNEPDNYSNLNNLGAFYLSTGEFDKAKKYLDSSMQIQETPGGNYNMGVYYARMGNFSKALEHFNNAEGVEKVTYNRGLAKLINNNPQGALEDFEAFTSTYEDVAIGHYVKAIAAARIGNETILHNSLRKAISLNSSLSDVAAEDLEFRKYWNDKDFKVASDDDPKDSISSSENE